MELGIPEGVPWLDPFPDEDAARRGVQNTEIEKEIGALGQTHFAEQIRRAEMVDELTSLCEAQRQPSLFETEESE